MKNIKPILFSTEMVQAVLAGRKTQTRRYCANSSEVFENYYTSNRFWNADIEDDPNPLAQFVQFRELQVQARYKEGDILWVRETWVRLHEAYLQKLDPDPLSPHFFYWYKADGEPVHFEHYNESWKPSIFMPKEAARIFLKVTDVRVERLQDISEEDALAEGIKVIDKDEAYFDYEFNGKNGHYATARGSFASLWQSINCKKHPWDSNPWVWVYTFERVEKPENFLA